MIINSYTNLNWSNAKRNFLTLSIYVLLLLFSLSLASFVSIVWNRLSPLIRFSLITHKVVFFVAIMSKTLEHLLMHCSFFRIVRANFHELLKIHSFIGICNFVCIPVDVISPCYFVSFFPFIIVQSLLDGQNPNFFFIKSIPLTSLPSLNSHM